MLTPKERLTAALQRAPVDRPPCICPGGMMNMIIEEFMDLSGISWPEAHSDPEKMAGLAASVYESGGFENYGVPFCMTVEAEGFGSPVDLGTKVNEPRVTDYILTSVSDWPRLPRLEANKGRAAAVLDAIRRLKAKDSGVPIIANLTGPISLASSLLEPMVYYRELRSKNEEAHRFMSFITENLIEFGKAQIKAGADVIAVAEPSGTGEILGPRMFKEFTVTYINLLLSGIREAGCGGAIVHICGRLRSIYPGLNDLECDAISFDSITGIRQVRQNVQNKAIMGNVSTYALEKASPAQIRLIAKYCLRNGVNILSPACGIGPRTKLSNIRELVAAAKEQGVPEGNNGH